MALGSLKNSEKSVVVSLNSSSALVVAGTVVISLITVVSLPMSNEKECTMSCTVLISSDVVDVGAAVVVEPAV